MYEIIEVRGAPCLSQKMRIPLLLPCGGIKKIEDMDILYMKIAVAVYYADYI